MRTRAYPEEAGCMDCGRGPTKWVRFWVNGMLYRVCKEHYREYRPRLLKHFNPQSRVIEMVKEEQ